MTLKDEKMSQGTGSILSVPSSSTSCGLTLSNRRFPAAMVRLPDKKQLREEKCLYLLASPSYGPSLWGSQEGNLKPPAVCYPQSRAESNQCVYARLLVLGSVSSLFTQFKPPAEEMEPPIVDWVFSCCFNENNAL